MAPRFAKAGSAVTACRVCCQPAVHPGLQLGPYCPRTYLVPPVLSHLFGMAQGDLNLNIAEAHAFNTADRFSLDVFVVNGWTGQVCPSPRLFVRCRTGPS